MTPTETQAPEITIDLTKEQVAPILIAIERAGLAPENLLSDCTYGVPDTDAGEGDKYLAKIRKNLPKGYFVEWTGSSNTDDDGETESDARFGLYHSAVAAK